MTDEKYFRVHEKVSPIIFKYKERLIPTVFIFNLGLIIVSLIISFVFFDIDKKVQQGVFHKDIEAWANTIYTIVMFFTAIAFFIINYGYFGEDAMIYKIKYTIEEKSEMLLSTNNFGIQEFDELFNKLEKDLDQIGGTIEQRKYSLMQDVYEERIFILIEKEKEYEPKSEYIKLFVEDE